MVPGALEPVLGAAAIAIGGSTGSVSVIGAILEALSDRSPAVLIVVHVPSEPLTRLSSLFARQTRLSVHEVEHGMPIQRGHVYVAPANYHFLVERSQSCALSIAPPEHFSRPAIDALFESAADVYEKHLIGVLLTGASHDGAQGLQAIRRRGGKAIVQDPTTAASRIMPDAGLNAVPDALVVPAFQLPKTLAPIVAS